jgi:hypothetical protein
MRQSEDKALRLVGLCPGLHLPSPKLHEPLRLGGHETESARAALLDYTEIVLKREWQSLGFSTRLDEEARDKWKFAYSGTLDLVPDSRRRESMRNTMIDQIREISALRIRREHSALVGTPNSLFLIATLTGIVLISVGYFPFPPTRVNLALLAMFGAYTGIILYLIFEFANPYRGAGFVEPIRFQRMFEAMQQAPK